MATDADRLIDIATKIARDAPDQQGKYVTHAKVYWGDIHKLREALDALGIPWRKS